MKNKKETSNKKDCIYVLCIDSLGSQQELYETCIKLGIPITYPELFIDGKIHHLWGVSKTGVGLVGTVVASHTPKELILHRPYQLYSIFNQ